MIGWAWELARLMRVQDADGIARYLDNCRLHPETVGPLLLAACSMIPVETMTREQLLAWSTWDEYGRPLEPVLEVPVPLRPVPARLPVAV